MQHTDTHGTLGTSQVEAASEATELMWDFDAQCVANTAWAYASLKVNDKSLMDAVGEYAVPKFTNWNKYFRFISLFLTFLQFS